MPVAGLIAGMAICRGRGDRDLLRRRGGRAAPVARLAGAQAAALARRRGPPVGGVSDRSVGVVVVAASRRGARHRAARAARSDPGIGAPDASRPATSWGWVRPACWRSRVPGRAPWPPTRRAVRGGVVPGAHRSGSPDRSWATSGSLRRDAVVSGRAVPRDLRGDRHHRVDPARSAGGDRGAAARGDRDSQHVGGVAARVIW